MHVCNTSIREERTIPRLSHDRSETRVGKTKEPRMVGSNMLLTASVAECDICRMPFKHLNYSRGEGRGEGGKARAIFDCPSQISAFISQRGAKGGATRNKLKMPNAARAGLLLRRDDREISQNKCFKDC